MNRMTRSTSHISGTPGHLFTGSKVAWGITISAAHLLSYNTKNLSSLRKSTIVCSITFVFETGVNWSSKVSFITLLLFQNLYQNQ